MIETTNSFCINNLLDTELEIIKNFTGEDLWQIIAKVIDCRELIDILEKKQHHNSLMNSEVRYHLRDMEVMLPIKLKLRDEFRKFHSLRCEFNALMSIVEKRNSTAMKSRAKEIDKKLVAVTKKMEKFKKTEMNARNTIAKSELNMTKLTQHKSMLHEFIDESRALMVQLNFDKANASPLNLEEKVRRMLESVEKFQNEIKTLNNHEYLVMSAEVKAIKVKIAIMNKTTTIDDVKKSVERCQQSFNFMHKKFFEGNVALKDTTKKLDQLNFDHHEQMAEILKQILGLDVELLKFKKNLIDIDYELQEFALENRLDLKYLNALKHIESIIRGNQSISQNYVGPLFTLFKAGKFKMWPKLIEISKTLIFSHGASARKLIKTLKASNVTHGDLVIIGIDEFVAKNRTNDSDSYDSLDYLIGDDERCREFLKSVLNEYVELNGDNVDETTDFHSVLIAKNSGSVTRSKGVLEFHSDNVETFEVLKKAHEIVKRYSMVQQQISEAKGVKSLLKQAIDGLKNPQRAVSLRIILEYGKEIIQLTQMLMATAKYLELTKCTIEKCNEIIKNPTDESVDDSQLDDLLRAKLASKIETELKVWQKLESQLNIPTDEISFECSLIEQLMKSELTYAPRWSDDLDKVLKKYEELVNESKQQSNQCKTELKALQASKEFQDVSTKVEELDLRYKSCIELVKEHHVAEIKNDCDEFIKSCTKENASLTNEKKLDEFAKKSNADVVDALLKVHEELTKIDKDAMLQQESFIHLTDSINKIVRYSISEVMYCRKNKIAAKSFHFLNQSFIKMLKDTVGNYQTSLRAVFSHFVERSALFFFTQGVFDEIKHDDFSWNCFDSSRLKAMDFVIEWRLGMREKISSDTLKQVKAVMLVLHVINYLSVFKFLLLDESFFDDMDENLKKSVLDYFKVVSPFVQIVIVQRQQEIDDPMTQETESEMMEVESTN